jgi:hypothetical protein
MSEVAERARVRMVEFRGVELGEKLLHEVFGVYGV